LRDGGRGERLRRADERTVEVIPVVAAGAALEPLTGSVSSNVLVATLAIFQTPFAARLPSTPPMTTMSPLLKPCDVAVTTIGVALVAPVTALIPVSAVLRSNNATFMVEPSQSIVPSKNPALPFSNKRAAISHLLLRRSIQTSDHP
jgi:hypothetical protein